MSCISMIGSRVHFPEDCNEVLPRTLPPWTKSKMRRLERFAVSEDPKFRAIAAAHPKLPAHMLIELLMDEEPTVRRAAIKNPNVTERMIHTALQDADMGIVAYARLLSGKLEVDS